MADISTAAVSSSLKVGLHIVSSYKRPVLEIYHQVCNRFGPEYEIDINQGAIDKGPRIQKIRDQEIFIQFTLVNIGSVRAENVELRISGPLKRNYPREDFGGLFKNIIPQIAPGQSLFLFIFDKSDLNKRQKDGDAASGIKEDSFTITLCYNAPPGFLNWFLALPNKLRGKKQFTTSYTFSPRYIASELPPPEYVA